MSMTYETEHGKANILRSASRQTGKPGRNYPQNQPWMFPASSSTRVDEADPMATSINTNSRRHASAMMHDGARIYHEQPTASSIFMAEHLRRLAERDGRQREAPLWVLLTDLLLDAEGSTQYHPEAIGIESVQPHRRWFISHMAHIQNLLQRHPLLRQAAIMCRWLEKMYRETSPEPRLVGEEEVVLRQLILTYIRGGELHKAIDAAVAYRDCAYSCILSASHLQSVKEAWLSQTAVVPLFGEYANGEMQATWVGNEHRLDNLSQLFEESQRFLQAGGVVGAAADGEAGLTATQSFDAMIGATLCGHLEVMEPAFAVHGSWRDTAWCWLRSMLVIAFTKAIAMGGGGSSSSMLDGPYADYVQQATGNDADWVEQWSKKMVDGLAARLAEVYLPHASLEDQLQMRLMLQVLSGNAATYFDIRPQPDNLHAIRLITHVLLELDAAYRELLLPHALQAYAGDSMACAVALYARQLATAQAEVGLEEGMRCTIAMASRLRDPAHRAEVYAAFVLAGRCAEMAMQVEPERAALEAQEAKLVRLFVEADADPRVREQVQHLLYQQVGEDQLLTHNKVAEQLLWAAMHAASPEDEARVLRRGLDACVLFWLSSPQAELEALADVARILFRTVLPRIIAPDDRPMVAEDLTHPLPVFDERLCSSMEYSEVLFWHLFNEARQVAQEHTRVAGELGVALVSASARQAASPADRTLHFQLAQDEVALIRKLHRLTHALVHHGGAVVYRSRQCLTAITWSVQQLAEDVALSFLCAESSDNGQEGQGKGGDHQLQEVMELVQMLDEAGYFHPDLLTQEHASDLFASIRALRGAYGRLRHRRDMVRVAAAAAMAAA